MLKKILSLNAGLVVKRPKTVLAAALLMTLLCGFLASDLELELNWVALAPGNEPSVREYERIMQDFPALSNIIVMIESEDADSLEKAVDAVQSRMEKNSWTASAIGRIPTDFLLDHGLLMVDENQIDEIAYGFADPSLNGLYSALPTAVTAESLRSLETFLSRMNSVYESGDPAGISDALTPLFSGNGIITSDDGKMALVTIQPSFGMMDMQKLIPGVNSIEEDLNAVDKSFPDVSIGATGMHIVARDEFISVESDSKLTVVLSIALILLLLYFAFRSFLAPVLTFVPLVLGIIWTVGLTRLTVGRLNMMTAFSAAMLLGLGIDYAIHLYSSYTEARSRKLTKTDSIRSALLTTGPSIIIGAVTTALAFLSLNISELAVLSELGTVMATGIIATLISVFWVLPALIILKKEKQDFSEKITGNYKFLGSVAELCHRGRFFLIPLLAAATVFMFFHARSAEFDMNLMNIEPRGLRSIELMEYMVDKYDLSSDSFSLEVDSLDDVYRYKQEFEAIENVARVTSIADVLPEAEEQQKRMERIRELRKTLEMIRPPAGPVDRGALISGLKNLSDAVDRFESDNEAAVKKLSETIAENRRLLSGMDDFALERIADSFRDSYGNLGERMMSPDLIQVGGLPDAFKSQFVGRGADKYLINIYPDFDIWGNLDTALGESFLSELSSVNDSVTGTPVFMKALYDQASSELRITGAVLFIILFAVVAIYFRSFKWALLVFVPLIISLVFMVGIMSLSGLKFNMLNFLSVLLVIGIGLDDGIHIVHHYLHDRESRNIRMLFARVGRAVLLTSLTTLIGFGSLMFSSYRGIASLGSALAIGVSLTFLMTVLIIPAFLRNREQ